MPADSLPGAGIFIAILCSVIFSAGLILHLSSGSESLSSAKQPEQVSQSADPKVAYTQAGMGCISEEYAKNTLGADAGIVLERFKRGVCFTLDKGREAELRYEGTPDHLGRYFVKIRVSGEVREIWTNQVGISEDPVNYVPVR
jgi:hypothetical protein